MTIDSPNLWRAAVLACLCASAAMAAPAVAPHYASIHRGSANLREGPSYDHRILWIYRHKDYPVKIVASFDAWRRVVDAQGTFGWMHLTQLSDRRTVVFVGTAKAALRRDDDPTSKIVAYAQPGVVAKLKACQLDVCEVDASGTDGWVAKHDIWGVDAGEVFQ